MVKCPNEPAKLWQVVNRFCILKRELDPLNPPKPKRGQDNRKHIFLVDIGSESNDGAGRYLVGLVNGKYWTE
jgi:hypothetical protein